LRQFWEYFRERWLGLSTVVDFERSRRIVSAEAVQAIRRALESAGVEFTNGDEPGVRLRKGGDPALSGWIHIDEAPRFPSVRNASPAGAERDIAVAEDVALDTTFAALLVFLLNLAFRGKL
jgi:hypothetical protein